MRYKKSMPQIVLAIDDDPIRYKKLARELDPLHTTVVVTHQLSEVLYYLEEPAYQIAGVCLDHDMPQQTGVYYARHVLGDLWHPVAIVSMNPDGARNIAAILKQAEVEHTIAPVSHEDWWARGLIRFFKI